MPAVAVAEASFARANITQLCSWFKRVAGVGTEIKRYQRSIAKHLTAKEDPFKPHFARAISFPLDSYIHVPAPF